MVRPTTQPAIIAPIVLADSPDEFPLPLGVGVEVDDEVDVDVDVGFIEDRGGAAVAEGRSDIAERVAATTVSAETQVPSRRPIWPDRQQKKLFVEPGALVAFHRVHVSSAHKGVAWKAETHCVVPGQQTLSLKLFPKWLQVNKSGQHHPLLHTIEDGGQVP